MERPRLLTLCALSRNNRPGVKSFEDCIIREVGRSIAGTKLLRESCPSRSGKRPMLLRLATAKLTQILDVEVCCDNVADGELSQMGQREGG